VSDDELVPYDLTAEPKAHVFLSPGWAERFKKLTPRSAPTVAAAGPTAMECAVSKAESSGTRLGRMMASEPELTKVAVSDADREFIRRFVDYVTADGFGTGSMVTRMERLKFETIVTGKTYGEVLAEADDP
jgi:hypothetical protein